MMTKEAIAASVTAEEIKEFSDVLSREFYRQLKKADRKTVSVIFARLYRLGMAEGARQAKELFDQQITERREAVVRGEAEPVRDEPEEVDWDFIMGVIQRLDSVSEAVAADIDAAVRGAVECEC